MQLLNVRSDADSLIFDFVSTCCAGATSLELLCTQHTNYKRRLDQEQVGAERCNDPGGACAVLSVAYVRVKQFCSKAKAARRLSRSAQGAPGGDVMLQTVNLLCFEHRGLSERGGWGPQMSPGEVFGLLSPNLILCGHGAEGCMLSDPLEKPRAIATCDRFLMGCQISPVSACSASKKSSWK
eukprot:scaffold9180_cov35-Tisochrysis_lutea.AAC.6